MKVEGKPAEIYQQHLVPAIFAQWAPDLVDTAGAAPGERVLDLACGTGVVTRCLAERVGAPGRVVGLDYSAGMLAAAKTASNGAPIVWVRGDATSLPFPDASFDAVVCQQGFQFFPHKQGALREIRRSLVGGGRMVLAVWRSVEHSPGMRVLQESLARRIGEERSVLPPFRFGSADALRALVTEAGFRDVKVRSEVKMTRFRSAEHFVQSSIGGAPTMLGALAEQGPEVIQELVKEVAASTREYRDDEGWSTPQATNIVTARA